MNVGIDSVLRSLDASVASLGAGEQERAGETLERIVATAPSFGPPSPRPRRLDDLGAAWSSPPRARSR